MQVDICIIGAGSAGLTVAAAAQQMGASCALIEKDLMGGDCLNYGCIPSKALIAAGRAANSIHQAKDFGISAGWPVVDSEKVYNHVRDIVDSIAPNDSLERFQALGVKVIQANGSFEGRDRVVAGNIIIRARQFVIATGSSAYIPQIDGLESVFYHTNKTIFDGPNLPEKLIIIGGGPLGIELAQAHRHLGCKVTVIEKFSIMSRDDPELVEVLRKKLDQEGVIIKEGCSILGVERLSNGVSVKIKAGLFEEKLSGTHLLIAAGRRPNVDSLDLEKAGIHYSSKGIMVDSRLRTSNKRIFAIGDVIGGYQFTHVASYHAGIVIQNALFRLPKKTNTDYIPRVTYTSPELAQVGLTLSEARKKHNNIKSLSWKYMNIDRPIAERQIDGLIKVITTKKGTIIGCGIVGAHAGELIQSWVLAISKKMKISEFATTISPYPTFGEISKKVAGSFYTDTLFSEKTKRLVRFLKLFF